MNEYSVRLHSHADCGPITGIEPIFHIAENRQGITVPLKCAAIARPQKLSIPTTRRRSKLRTGTFRELPSERLLAKPRSANVQLNLYRQRWIPGQSLLGHTRPRSFMPSCTEHQKRHSLRVGMMIYPHNWQFLQKLGQFRRWAHMAAWCMRTRLEGSIMLLALPSSLSDTHSAKVLPLKLCTSTARCPWSGNCA